jgi:glycosyltransferase involved in cell wall biosynthesis
VTESPAPLVSIIIVVRRDRAELERLLGSILSQRTPETEVIVIDGGSTDGTREVLERHDAELAHWVSEPDRGLYEAMNKGIAAARGRYFLHLNAGDRLLCVPHGELRAAEAAAVDILACVVLLDGTRPFRPAAGWRLRLNNTLHHQGTFYRRATFPGYDTRYPVYADFDANQRLVRQGARVMLSETPVATHATDGLSYRKGGLRENLRIVAANQGRIYVPLAWLDHAYHGLQRRITK